MQVLEAVEKEPEMRDSHFFLDIDDDEAIENVLGLVDLARKQDVKRSPLILA